MLFLRVYAVQILESVPLGNIWAHTVANAFFQVITRVGMLKKILMDQDISLTNTR